MKLHYAQASTTFIQWHKSQLKQVHFYKISKEPGTWSNKLISFSLPCNQINKTPLFANQKGRQKFSTYTEPTPGADRYGTTYGRWSIPAIPIK